MDSAPARDAAATRDAGSDVSVDAASTPRFGFDTRPVNRSCHLPERRPPRPTIVVTPAFPGLPTFPQPLGILQAPGDPSRWFMFLQRGLVQTFDNRPDVGASTIFLNINDRVNWDPDEAGLLGFAFDPDFATNGTVYVSYTGHGGAIDLTSRVSRFKSKDGGKTIDPASEEILLSLEQPFLNHNGGNIAFGPDGYLYVGFGDGGSAYDPDGNGQNRGVLLGKMLRLAVKPAGPYTIPPSNPYAGSGALKKEIYAFGFRNPWRFSFDRNTGDLWVGDVGQGQREEVDRVELGGNYGWRIHEGTVCVYPNCVAPGLIDPLYDYDHTEGIAIIGGYLYSGTAIPELVGSYVFADYYTATIWALVRNANTGALERVSLGQMPNYLSSFGEDANGELYATDYGTGQLFQLAKGADDGDAGDPSDAGPEFPSRLSETGCVDPAEPARFANGVLPYYVRVPEWADGATIQRGFALPDGAKIHVTDSGRWELPVGAVALETYFAGDRALETRLVVRHASTTYRTYSYEWNADGTDATLLSGARTLKVGGHEYPVPHPGECVSCHSDGAGRFLGFETQQMNRDVSYPNGAVVNQLDQFSHIGLFEPTLPGPASGLPVLPAPSGKDSVEVRARAYLHANCASCHHHGSAEGLDLSYSTRFEDTGLCNAAAPYAYPDVIDPRVVAPGDLARSVLSLAVHAEGAHRMPPLDRRSVDLEAVKTIDAWITAMAPCPATAADGGNRD